MDQFVRKILLSDVDRITSGERGKVSVTLDGKLLDVIDAVGLEQYLKGVVPSEMPSKWPAAALAAQAVAARSYALANLTKEFAADDDKKNAWIRHWIERGLSALEAERRGPTDAAFAFGDRATFADCLLVPQVYNAERFHCDVSKFPRLYAIAKRCRELPAFEKAHPDRQPDAPRK